jgi:hypothetical protein
MDWRFSKKQRIITAKWRHRLPIRQCFCRCHVLLRYLFSLRWVWHTFLQNWTVNCSVSLWMKHLDVRCDNRQHCTYTLPAFCPSLFTLYDTLYLLLTSYHSRLFWSLVPVTLCYIMMAPPIIFNLSFLLASPSSPPQSIFYYYFVIYYFVITLSAISFIRNNKQWIHWTSLNIATVVLSAPFASFQSGSQ